MNNSDLETLSVLIEKSPHALLEHFLIERERKEYQLAWALFKQISTGEWFTVKVDRTDISDIYESVDFHDPQREVFRTHVNIGKVKPVQLEWKHPKKLTFKERLHVLFTGEIPSVLVEK
jgi:hypothetical protein